MRTLRGAVLLAIAMTSSSIASAADWTAGAWRSSPQQVGLCQLDESGAANRLEIREVICLSATGVQLRRVDCDGRTKPEETRYQSCRMKWSCLDWTDKVFAEGERNKRESYRPTRSSRIGATLACTNAKEANPNGVAGCRASKIDGMIENLTSPPTLLSPNGNYAYVSCHKAD